MYIFYPRHFRSPPSTGTSTQSGSEPADGEAPVDQEETVSHASEERSGEGANERKESVTSKPEVPVEVRAFVQHTVYMGTSLKFPDITYQSDFENNPTVLYIILSNYCDTFAINL